MQVDMSISLWKPICMQHISLQSIKAGISQVKSAVGVAVRRRAFLLIPWRSWSQQKCIPLPHSEFLCKLYGHCLDFRVLCQGIFT